MLYDFKPTRVLYFDCETASSVPNYATLPPALQRLWGERVKHKMKEGETVEQYFEREAGLSAEFGRIVCISVGKLRKADDDSFKIEIQTFSGDEKTLLKDFADLVGKLPNDVSLAAYNGREFDVPFICRRMILNGIHIPHQLNPTGKKPWDDNFIDPMLLWRLGEFRHYAKMDLLANLLDIPSSKGDIEGAAVSAAFWRGEADRIITYCQKDVVVLASILLKFAGLPIIQEANVSVKIAV